MTVQETAKTDLVMNLKMQVGILGEGSDYSAYLLDVIKALKFDQISLSRAQNLTVCYGFMAQVQKLAGKG